MSTNRWCFCWLADNPRVTGKDRAALLKDARWTAGDVISISFLDGDPRVWRRVKGVAQRWTKFANLRFDFREAKDTLVRISFAYKGSWSVLGTTCRKVPKDEPTMNFGWLTPASTAEEVRRVVLHEFGHALGLIHEHQNPAGGILWDKARVYAELQQAPHNWSKQTIDRNLFATYKASETNFTATDPKSIMMYPIPKRWTKNGFSAALNGNLSRTDQTFIRQRYS